MLAVMSVFSVDVCVSQSNKGILLREPKDFMEMVHFIPSSQRRFALLAAQADTVPALIYGASGTGKGAIARWIHANGPRAARVFLIAKQDRPLTDQILEAQGGTLMIPEIGEWPLSEQKTLLGFLKNKSVSRAEGKDQSSAMPTIANVRIIGTTSQSLEGRAQGGLFNIELLEKLNVFRIEMPPLAKRTDEFNDIVTGIIGEITRELHKEHLRSLSSDTWTRLKSYDWPGNLRELRNVLRLAVTSAKGDQIEVEDLPDFGYTRVDFRATREQFEKTYLLELLKTFNWEIDKTCRMTRIDKSTLLAKIKNYGITL
jgi:DNA-binding NtrC family response regulator